MANKLKRLVKNWNHIHRCDSCYTLQVRSRHFMLPVFSKLVRMYSMASAREHGFQFKELKGDLFSCDKDTSLAHCISADVKMGKGIATMFKKLFGGVDELVKQGGKPGEVSILQRHDRFIYYLVTKTRYFHKPTYDTLRSSLIAMKQHCVENNVTKLAMPRIGCGLDKLEWDEVKEIIKETFKDVEIDVTVYTL